MQHYIHFYAKMQICKVLSFEKNCVDDIVPITCSFFLETPQPGFERIRGTAQGRDITAAYNRNVMHAVCIHAMPNHSQPSSFLIFSSLVCGQTLLYACDWQLAKPPRSFETAIRTHFKFQRASMMRLIEVYLRIESSLNGCNLYVNYPVSRGCSCVCAFSTCLHRRTIFLIKWVRLSLSQSERRTRAALPTSAPPQAVAPPAAAKPRGGKAAAAVSHAQAMAAQAAAVQTATFLSYKTDQMISDADLHETGAIRRHAFATTAASLEAKLAAL
jgi:hypothetical protein